MATKAKQRMVRAFWEVPVKGRKDPAIVSRDAVLSTPRYMTAVEAELRRKILDVIADAEGLHLDQSVGWWERVITAARREPGVALR